MISCGIHGSEGRPQHSPGTILKRRNYARGVDLRTSWHTRRDPEEEELCAWPGAENILAYPARF